MKNIYIYIPPYSCCEFFFKLPCRHSLSAPVPAQLLPCSSLENPQQLTQNKVKDSHFTHNEDE